jgi:glucose-6-phosphate dehydrogenase assembly protein OpcA
MQGGQTLAWVDAPIDVARIDEELARLRYNAAGSPPGGESYAMRTSLLNLVVYAADEAGAEQASQTIDGLTRDHPSRALIIIAAPSEGESVIEVRCSAHCHITPGLEQQVCCEEVLLKVSGRAAEHLHSIIVPLLVPDLPDYVWWTGPLPRGRHLFEELMESADRFVVDSSRFRHPTHGLIRVAELCAETPGCAVSDINWARMDPWRDILLLHGGSPEMRAYREAVTTVEIAYAGGAGTPAPAAAFLLAGWLAERLGWDASTPAVEEGSVTVRRGALPISIRLIPRNAPLVEPGSLLRVRLEDENGAALTVMRADDPQYLEIEVRSPDYTGRGLVLTPSPDASEMLAEELDDLPGQSSEYEQALQKALPIIRALDVSHD